MMLLKGEIGKARLACKYGSEEGLVQCKNCPMINECPMKNKRSKPLLLALL